MESSSDGQASTTAVEWQLHAADSEWRVPDWALLAVDFEAAARRARLRHLLLDVEDHVGELSTWPHREQALALSGRPPSSRGDIHRFILFHLGNRCPPAPLARLLVDGSLLKDSKAGRDAWDSVPVAASGPCVAVGDPVSCFENFNRTQSVP
jgi:hypothetical protein